jgi:hypothetical protein
MRFRDEDIDRQWAALQVAKQQRFLQVLQIAMTAAWDDLPDNERDRYLAFALTAVKETESVN